MTLPQSQQKTPLYKTIADEAKALWDDPANLSIREIARRLGTTDATVGKAIAWWHRSRGFPVPTAKDRRARLEARAKALFDDHVEIKEIARTLGYTPRGMALLLKKIFARAGETKPDGRVNRSRQSKANRKPDAAA